MKARAIDANVTQGTVLGLVDSRLETFERAQQLVTFLDDRLGLKAKMAGARRPWLEALGTRLADMQAQDPMLRALPQTCTDVRGLEGARRELLAKALDVPADAERSEDFNEAVARLVAGKSAFGLPFGKGEARKLVAAVTVLGVAPASKQDWLLVRLR